MRMVDCGVFFTGGRSFSSPDLRQLLHWLFFEEADKDEVCRRLDIDRNYLRVLLHRAKQRFKTEFVGS